MSETKSLSFTRSYRVTEATIRSRPNAYVEIWHLAIPINNPIGTFRIKIKQGNRTVAYSDESNWQNVITTCQMLNYWGISAERFSVSGSTTYKDNDVQKELGAKNDE